MIKKKIPESKDDIYSRIHAAKQLIEFQLDQRKVLLNELRKVERMITEAVRTDDEKKIKALRKRISEL